MKALLVVRHGKPDIDRKETLKASKFEDWWALYDKKGIDKSLSPSDRLVEICKDFKHVNASSSIRAKESAQFIFGQDQKITQNKHFIEADLPAPPIPFIGLQARAWCTISRFFWNITMTKGKESQKEAWKRVSKAADIVEEICKEEDQALFAHGYFNWMLSRELKKRGWKVKLSSKDHKYWSYRYYVK